MIGRSVAYVTIPLLERIEQPVPIAVTAARITIHIKATRLRIGAPAYRQPPSGYTFQRKLGSIPGNILIGKAGECAATKK